MEIRNRIDPVCSHLQRADDDLNALEGLDHRAVNAGFNRRARTDGEDEGATNAKQLPMFHLQHTRPEIAMDSSTMCMFAVSYVLCLVMVIVMLAIAARGHSTASACALVD
jgi:hypothetical protein